MATLEELATEKERELQCLRERVALANKENIKGIENELTSERSKLTQLRADFDYNLTLLTQRDEELARYEDTFAGVKRVVNSLMAENSQLKAQLANAEEKLSLSREEKEEIRKHCTKRINEVHSRLQHVRQLQQSELDKEKEKLRETQREFEQKMTDLEGDLACQRDEVTSHFEQILREREAEYETRSHALQCSLVSNEDRLRGTVRELEVARAALHGMETEVAERAHQLAAVEKEVREKQWALEDQSSVQTGVIRDLERRLSQAEGKLSKQAQEFVQRHSELDGRLREKESVLRSAREAHTSRITEMEEKVSSIKGQLEAKDSEITQLQWQHEEAMRENKAEVERCKHEMERCRRECSDAMEKCRCEFVGQLEEVTGEVVTRDLQLEALKDQMDHLRTTEEQLRGQLDRCKGELKCAVKTGREQEQTIAQLAAVRDKLVTECHELRAKLSNSEEQSHVTEAQNHVTESEESRDHVITQLQQQNSDLHNVIRQMRTELETIAEPTNQISASYVQYMERELKELKSKNRELEVKLQSRHVTAEKPPRSPRPDSHHVTTEQGHVTTAKSHVTDSRGHMISEAIHRSHVIALSDTIAALQRDKSGLEVELTQCRTRVGRLEILVQEHKEKLYSLKSCQVPQSKVHQKLVHATHVIIALLREKEQLVQQLKSHVDIQTPQVHMVKDQVLDTQAQTITAPTVKTYSQPLSGQSLQGKIPSPDTQVTNHSVQVERVDIHTQTDVLLRNTETEMQREPSITSLRGTPHSTEEFSPTVRDFPMPDGDFPPLRFTDSSLGSLDNVLAMVEQGLSDSDTLRRTSTPTGPRRPSKRHSQAEHQLELVGQKAQGSVRPGTKLKVQPRKLQVKRNKKFVRNYNIKD